MQVYLAGFLLWLFAGLVFLSNADSIVRGTVFEQSAHCLWEIMIARSESILSGYKFGRTTAVQIRKAKIKAFRDWCQRLHCYIPWGSRLSEMVKRHMMNEAKVVQTVAQEHLGACSCDNTMLPHSPFAICYGTSARKGGKLLEWGIESPNLFAISYHALLPKWEGYNRYNVYFKTKA